MQLQDSQTKETRGNFWTQVPEQQRGIIEGKEKSLEPPWNLESKPYTDCRALPNVSRTRQVKTRVDLAKISSSILLFIDAGKCILNSMQMVEIKKHVMVWLCSVPRAHVRIQEGSEGNDQIGRVLAQSVNWSQIGLTGW